MKKEQFCRRNRPLWVFVINSIHSSSTRTHIAADLLSSLIGHAPISGEYSARTRWVGSIYFCQCLPHYFCSRFLLAVASVAPCSHAFSWPWPVYRGLVCTAPLACPSLC